MAFSQLMFGIWDYVIVVIVLMISSFIGIYYRFTGGKQKTMEEFLLADKNMSITPVAFSLMASFMSAITILGVSSENYTLRTATDQLSKRCFFLYFFLLGIFSFRGATCLVSASASYVPQYKEQSQYKSVWCKKGQPTQYLELRFGKTSRLAASLSYTLQMTLYMGVVVYAPALALEALTGISKIAAILSIGLVCTFYSTIGGMKAVLITDVFQSLLMFVAVFSVIGSALVEKGSFAEIWEIAEKGDRTNLLNFNPDPTERHSWFSLIIGGGITFLSLYAVNQTQVQRYLTINNLKDAQKALWWNWPILTALSLSTSFSGLCIYSRYVNCDPIKAGKINSIDQLMPYYVVDTMGQIPGLSGLFVAGIFSASLSTVSASLNSLAAVSIEDYYKPLHKMIFKRDLPMQSASLQTKVIAFTYGLVCIAVAFLAQFLGGVLQAALTIFGVVGGPLLGLFSLGMFTLTANETGAVSGLAAGIAIAMLMAFGPKPPIVALPTNTEGCDISLSNINETIYNNTSSNDSWDYSWIFRVSYLYNGVFGLLVTLTVGYVISFIARKLWGKRVEDENYDPNLFIPYLSEYLKKQKDNHMKLTDLSKAREDTNSNLDKSKC